MTYGRGIRPAKASNLICSRNSRCLRRLSPRGASRSGRWWNSRPTTRLPPAAAVSQDRRVERVIICTPDKDLAQCVRGERVVQLNRRTRATLDEAGVIRKFGVSPESIPDYLALVGDAADGYPGLPGWGAKSTAAILAKFGHIECIPADSSEWAVNVVSAGGLAATLAANRDLALLFRRLATLRTDIALFEDVEQLRWKGPTPAFEAIGSRLDAAVTAPRRRRLESRRQAESQTPLRV
jgi:5'-3' exonuclease